MQSRPYAHAVTSLCACSHVPMRMQSCPYADAVSSRRDRSGVSGGIEYAGPASRALVAGSRVLGRVPGVSWARPAGRRQTPPHQTPQSASSRDASPIDNLSFRPSQNLPAPLACRVCILSGGRAPSRSRKQPPSDSHTRTRGACKGGGWVVRMLWVAPGWMRESDASLAGQVTLVTREKIPVH